MKPGEMDYYEVLGLKPGASKEEVGTAYRKKSLRVHPDRYKGDDPEAATAEFMRLTTAKEVLLDDKARAAFETLQSARDAHRAKQEAQQAGRKKMREALEKLAERRRGEVLLGRPAQAHLRSSLRSRRRPRVRRCRR